MTLPRRELLPIPAPMPHHFRVLLMMMVQLPEPLYPLAQPLARALLPQRAARDNASGDCVLGGARRARAPAPGQEGPAEVWAAAAHPQRLLLLLLLLLRRRQRRLLRRLPRRLRARAQHGCMPRRWRPRSDKQRVTSVI